MRSHVSIQFRAIFPGTVDPGIVRSRLRRHLEDMGAVSFTEWPVDPVRCLSCNQAESEDVRISQGVCQFCRQEQEPA